MSYRFIWALGFVLFLMAGECRAQVPPFIGNGAALFAPQIGVVNSGVQNDVQAVVSADRKYVTLTMRPQISTLLALQTFEFQTASGQNGFVGGVMGPVGGDSDGGHGGVRTPPTTPGAASQAPAPMVLAQKGMTRMGPP